MARSRFFDSCGISDFHALQADLAAGRTDRLVYVVFDVLYLDGYDLRSVPLEDRQRMLAELVARRHDVRLRMSEFLEGDGPAAFRTACARQMEGIVSKKRGSMYRSGEQHTWIKSKCRKTETYPIVAFVEKLGARPRRIASLYVGRRDRDRLLYAGKVGTGYTEAQQYELRERLNPLIRGTSPLSIAVKKPKATWVEPLLAAEVEYGSITSAGVLRAASFKGIRDDLLPQAAQSGAANKSWQASHHHQVRVPKENILQLLPDAVIPSEEQLTRYWRKVAPRALKYLAGRPLKLVRHVHGTAFYHKGRLPPVPASVRQLRIEKREGGESTRVWVDDLGGLLGLVEMNVIEVHPWNSKVDHLEHADQLVFDLDPGEGVEWEFVREVALVLRELLRVENLPSWPKVTGGKGIHVMVPLDQPMSHDEAHRYSRNLAQRLAAIDPRRLTISAEISRAEGETLLGLFAQWARNDRRRYVLPASSPRLSDRGSCDMEANRERTTARRIQPVSTLPCPSRPWT
ncbi:MAG: putative ATP-dependent ligase protein [Gammaproteobacteria bacterium]|nr:putative ATP-dependent ligase protein [Gammaproteobacteria bacterium]